MKNKITIFSNNLCFGKFITKKNNTILYLEFNNFLFNLPDWNELILNINNFYNNYVIDFNYKIKINLINSNIYDISKYYEIIYLFINDDYIKNINKQYLTSIDIINNNIVINTILNKIINYYKPIFNINLISPD
jgi:hypothetical protein